MCTCVIYYIPTLNGIPKHKQTSQSGQREAKTSIQTHEYQSFTIYVQELLFRFKRVGENVSNDMLR